MIGMLSGVVESIDSRCALICVCGVGYEVYMPSSDLSSLREGQEVKVYTSLQVSQDAITLYGFTSIAAKRIFLQIQQKVSGVGPKVALSLLSTLSVDRLMQAIADSDVSALSSAPGLGKKGAQKIILELKGSIDMSLLSKDSVDKNANKNISDFGDSSMRKVVVGLMSLGWKQFDAQKAVENVCAQEDISLPISDADMPKVLRMALSSLDRGR